MKQQIFIGMHELDHILKNIRAKDVFVVFMGKSFDDLGLGDYTKNLDVKLEIFNEFTPNPKQEDAEKGNGIFKNGHYDAILAIGGGSSLDVAKYIKQFTPMPLIAVPTTAGSGSEATKFAVIYSNGVKQSITSESIIPEYVILEPAVLKTLPLYQKKCTMLDALCQAIEAYWSVNASEESKGYSAHAIKAITENYRAYILQDERVYESIMLASNQAGQAINIAQTTAAHAMSYKITSMLNLPHGHAVAICLPAVWQFMQNNTGLCNDARGEQYLKKTLDNLSELIDLPTFNKILTELEIHPPQGVTEMQIAELVDAVNVTRLGNFPITLSKNNLQDLYNEIMKR